MTQFLVIIFFILLSPVSKGVLIPSLCFLPRTLRMTIVSSLSRHILFETFMLLTIRLIRVLLLRTCRVFVPGLHLIIVVFYFLFVFLLLSFLFLLLYLSYPLIIHRYGRNHLLNILSLRRLFRLLSLLILLGLLLWWLLGSLILHLRYVYILWWSMLWYL